MNLSPALLLAVVWLAVVDASCAGRRPETPPTSPTPPPPATQAAPPARADPAALQALHVRLEVSPVTGDVTYFGAYDGRRNLLGPAGITTALVGVAPPEMRGELTKPAAGELVFRGIDQNQVAWTKRYRVVDDQTVDVTHAVRNRGDRAFDAILYSLADLPDATIGGDNRDQHVRSPVAAAHFHADVENPHFPGEQMNPSALRSDSKHLEPGDSLTFHMTWRLELARASRP
jgi:hypothetical protein